MSDYANDGRWPDETPVLVRYPRGDYDDPGPARDEWPWLRGTVLEQVGPDEWLVVVEEPELAMPGRDYPHDGHNDETVYPTCWRSADELRPRLAHAGSTEG